MDTDPLTVAKAAFAARPNTVRRTNLLHWLLDEKRAGGPQGFIGFAISVRMSEALRSAILEEGKWQAYGEPDP